MISNLSYLIYVSLAAKPLSESNLDEILKASHQYNDDNLISGILLYVEGRFFQVLEGPVEEVESLLEQFQEINVTKMQLLLPKVRLTQDCLKVGT